LRGMPDRSGLLRHLKARCVAGFQVAAIAFGQPYTRRLRRLG